MTKRRDDRFDQQRAIREAQRHENTRAFHRESCADLGGTVDPGTGGGGGGTVITLETPRNVLTSFNSGSREHAVTWTGPASLTGYSTTFITVYGSSTLTGGGTQLYTASRSSTSANQAMSWSQVWTTTEKSNYAYAYMTVKHMAVTDGTANSSATVTSGRISTGGGGGGPAPGTSVADPTAPTITYTSGNFTLASTWVAPTPTTDIANVQVRFQARTGTTGGWTTIATQTKTTSQNSASYITTSSERTTYTEARVQLQSISSNVAVNDGNLVNSTTVTFGTGGGGVGGSLPSVALSGTPTASPSAGINFRFVSTGTSGLPNGNATTYDYRVWRGDSSGITWPTDPDSPGAAGGTMHESGTIPSNGSSSGSTATYLKQVNYFKDQATDQQKWFRVFVRARNGAGNTTAWTVSSTFSLTTPATPPNITSTSSKFYADATGAVYFNVTQPFAADDFRSSATPPSASMGENDIGYWIDWAIGSTTPTSWPNAAVFRQTSSALGNGVTAGASSYTFRVPATGTLTGTTISRTQKLYVRVRVQYVGDGGSDSQGSSMKGGFSGYSGPFQLSPG